jgi:acetyltransferase-like isoleucine patch superfamily enzyme
MKLPLMAMIVLNQVVRREVPPQSLVYGNPAP